MWCPLLNEGVDPDIPETKMLDNSCTYTGYRSASTHSR